MRRFKSGIILKSRVVLAPDENESHFDLLKSMNIEDEYVNATKNFVKVELIPPDGNKAADISIWKYSVEQDILPDWYENDPERYEQEFRSEVAEYLKDRITTVICGYAWTSIKVDKVGTYYLMDGYLGESKFGEDNNYAKSDIRNTLNNSKLAAALKNEFGNKLVPITTDLLSLDGLSDYGKVEGDILAIPTIDLYRECRQNIPKIDVWWWIATPDSTPSGCGSMYVRYILSGGNVSGGSCDCCGAVRPFFILKN